MSPKKSLKQKPAPDAIRRKGKAPVESTDSDDLSDEDTEE